MTSSGSSQVKPEFSVRIVVCDHYLTKPNAGIDVIYSEFRGSDIKQVPVLRIFGSAPDGRKACLHVHGVFPYFYIPCPTSNPEPQFLYQIAASLDKALNIALKQATAATQHVYKISLVKGLPNLIKQAVELCANGAILGQTFQPHESHLNFTLQFFIDFNLFGMSNIDLQTVKFRRSGISQNSTEPFDETEFSLKPESVCYYEADCIASHIINRQRIGKGDGIENPGLEEVWKQETERRKQLNISMASKSLSQGRIDTEQTKSHYKFEQMCLVKLSGLIDKPAELQPNKETVQYPAESLEGSQLFDATNVSLHLPEKSFGTSLSDSMRRSLEDTLTDDADNTLVDENLALNCSLSLHYSQVQLDNEDLELVDMLQDMDDKPVEEDSMLATPADQEEEAEVDDVEAEYSQVFHDDTLVLDSESAFSKGDIEEESSPSWNDSFWEGANIPQLDGTCDDDHVKKVRKRKMRPLKLGLSRPKSKKKETTEFQPNLDKESMQDTEEADVINASRDTIDSISDFHIKRSIKLGKRSIKEECNVNVAIDDNSNESIIDLVNKMSVKHESSVLRAAEKYDIQKEFEPVAGPSKAHFEKTDVNKTFYESLNESYESTPEADDDSKGIMSFYDMSKMFDLSLEDRDDENNATLKSDTDLNLSLEHTTKKVSDVTMSKIETTVIKDTDITPQKHTDEIIKSPLVISCDNLPVILTPKFRPPTTNYVLSTLAEYNIPKNKNATPYYSDHRDVGEKIEIGQMVLKVNSKTARDQKPYERVLDTTSLEEWRQLMFLESHEMNEEASKPDALRMFLAGNRQCILEPVRKAPTYKEVHEWAEAKKKSEPKRVEKVENTSLSKNIDDLDNSQAIGLNYTDDINSSLSLEPSDKDKSNLDSTIQVSMQPDGSFLCFGTSESPKDNSSLDTAKVEVDFLTVMLLEILTSVRGDLHPDPLIDPIQAVFLTVSNDCPPNHFLEKGLTEIIVVDEMSPPKWLDRCILTKKVKISYVNNESEIIESVVEFIRKHDPDIMCGYEIEMASWGYFLERSQVLGFEIVKDVSRIIEKNRQKKWRSEENDFEGRIIGRITFNVWRLFRHELALSSYSFENCMYEILKERVPKYSYAELFEWWSHESRMMRWLPVEFYLTRLSGTLRMMEKLDMIKRTSELARLFGLQWWEVLSRGSQFRVESLMLRAARPLNLVALSPTVRQRAAMKAPEILPLIFEPESRFYSDPVIVLDFQSLYPSMMIAYNYCFSTCIGRVHNINGDASYEFGAWRLRIPKAKLETLVKNGLVNWSPVGVGFVKPSVRRGVLPALLRRILAARQAVKKGMKLQTDENVKKAMYSRQLGLKLIANVTYGYTAANFSGRMPCVEVADSVVAKGRETLERAISLVRDSKRWNAKVVYGDTDSMFVAVAGGSRAEAFAIGREIAAAVSADSPAPVALQLEKVYQPCILQTKKRYVGFMYESEDQETPVFEAKGIETVRRDGCPAAVQLLQRSLMDLFSHGDMSRVKRLVVRELGALAAARSPVPRLLFTREYHGPANTSAAPQQRCAQRIAARDRRATPRTGERVPWMVTAGPPGAPLIKLARTPEEILRDPSLTPHVAYYATRVLLPPLHRCLSLLGVNVFKWWAELGYQREAKPRAVVGGIARYMTRRNVGQPHHTTHQPATVVQLGATQSSHLLALDEICRSCCGHEQYRSCGNTECPVLWRRRTAQQQLDEVKDIMASMPAHFPAQSIDF